MDIPAILNNDMFTAFSTASGHVYIYVCDVAADVSHWSPNAVDYFGMPGEYLEHAGALWAEHVHPDDRARYNEDISAVFSGKATRHRCEYRARNRRGEYVWLECRGSMIQDEEGNPKFFAGMMTRLDAQNKYDPVTTLKSFYEFGSLSFQEGRGSLLLIGMDGFRQIINNYGYACGNRLLYEFGQRLRELCGEALPLFRMDGDEFAIVAPNYGRMEADVLFQQVRRLGRDLDTGGGGRVSLALSGGALRYPDDGTEQDTLLRNLEYTLEHARETRQEELVFFSSDLANLHNRTELLRRELTESIRNNFDGFCIYYQPMVDAASYRMVCCEALLRWTGPTLGRVPIPDVIRQLEYSGEIRQVGRWIVDHVFQKSKEWQEKCPGFLLHFNTSYLQFQEPDFTDYLIRRATELEVNPQFISIELTESSNVEDIQALAVQFRRLREFGFRISLDDFGIAYSTLLLIRNLPADSVKIDQSFIMNLTADNRVDQAIVESVVALCRRLGIHVVAEGVENRQVLGVMEQFNIDLFQGYYFDKPLPEDAFEAAIGKQYPR